MKKIPLPFLFLFLILLSAAGCHPENRNPDKTGTISTRAMVVTAYPEASSAGKSILAQGGNVVDAAAAIELALAVCYPTAGNIGGGGFMVMRFNTGELDCIDYREKAPLKASRNMFLDGNDQVIPDASTRSHLAAGVPGTVAGIWEAHGKYGLLPWETIVEPAIRLAREGFPLTEKQARSFNQVRKRLEEMNDWLPPLLSKEKWEAGDTLVQPELAQTLERIQQQGRDGFYRGKTAELLVEEMKRGGGLINYQDLEEYQPVWRTPLTGSYRGYRIISMSPPSSGGVGLLQMLGMVESFDIASMGWNAADAVHLMTEAERRAYADRAYYLGDPDFVEIPVEELIDREYLASRMKDFDPDKAGVSSLITEGRVPYGESEETTHYSIVDPMGNALAGTTTLNGGYGSGIVVKGGGFLLNNQMDDFSIKPGFPNYYGLVGGEANSIAPGKRMLSSMTPTIVEKDGKLFMVVGTPGGSTIITSVFQTIVNVIDHGMGMQEAVAAGRFHHQWLPDSIQMEEGALTPATIEDLKARGHHLLTRSSIGRVDAILVLSDGRLEGGADPRGDDTAAGMDR